MASDFWRKSPESAFIEVSSLISRPSNPISPRMISRTTFSDVVAGAAGSIGAVDDMRGHAHRQVIERLERREIMCAQLLQRRIDDRQFEMRVGKGAAVAGHMLHHRQHAARHQALGGSAAKDRHRFGIRCHRRARR